MAITALATVAKSALSTVAKTAAKQAAKQAAKKAAGKAAKVYLADKAKDIITSGKRYIEKNLTGKGYEVRLADVKKAISDMEAGRKRYTKKDIEKLQKTFNRSRLRANAYAKLPIESERVVTREGDVKSLPHTRTVTIGTASESAETKIRNLAKIINRESKKWTKMSEPAKNLFLSTIAEIPENLRNDWTDILNGGDIINLSKVTPEDGQELLTAFEHINEHVDLSQSAEQAVKEYYDDIDDRLKNEYGVEIGHWDVYHLLKDDQLMMDWDSETARDIKMTYYEEVKPRELYRKAAEILLKNSDGKIILQKLKELARAY